MTEKEIFDRVKIILNRALAGLEIENPKVELKSQWYDLTSEQGLSEFIKDTSAIANTVGLDGFLIIGYDEKGKIFKPAKFSDCKLRDTADLVGLIAKRINEAFNISYYSMPYQGVVVDVLHIPSSLNKPHVVRLHKSFDKTGAVRKEEELCRIIEILAKERA
ncbi:AlbA family DNA-binding domain-containing protein [Foetidibacter luteolus]|uniref:AlbA family DNA-binding domain-containing protein n=1 Tax=Foetidibacter luteolus TaxID=2608880 RepID=UPI001A9A227B|nr:ATP-binding protein [Foetidibacter luteolus]